MARKNPQNRQAVLVRLETLAHQEKTGQGTLPRKEFIDRWEEELHRDTTLLGFDFRTHATNDVAQLFDLRHPDWTQPLLECFADRLWIPYNEKGDMVLLVMATEEHWAAFREIQRQNNDRQNWAYKAFKDRDAWLKRHWKPGHGNIGDVMRDNPAP